MEVKQEYEVDKESYYKAKKYVIKIYPENIHQVESLDPRARDQFINEAINVYLNKYNFYQKQIASVQKIKKTIVYSVCSLLILALMSGIFRFVLVYSNAVDNEMKNNFQRLFDTRQNYNSD